MLCTVVFAMATPTLAEGPLKVAKGDTPVSVQAGDRLVMRYKYGGVPFKPYVEQFLTPAGINVLRDSPHDHKHHHALMFAVAVDGVNFWEEHKAPGRQVHRDFDGIRTGKQKGLDRATFTEQVDWVNPPTKKVHVQERRTIDVYDAKDLKASLLTWQSRFSLPEGKAKATLSGSTYFGLGARFLQSMDKDGVFRNADGKTGVEGTNDIRSKWCAYTARADGKPVTVAMFDHPKNPRHPATWFTLERGFAYLSNTLNLSKEPLEFTAAKPLTLRYGVAVWDGQVEKEEIESVYRRWAALPFGKATPSGQ